MNQSAPWNEPCPSLEDLYVLDALGRDWADGAGELSPERAESALYWRSCQFSTHLFAVLSKRDSWTGAAYPQRLQDVLTRLADESATAPAIPDDALTRMVEYCGAAMAAILEAPRARLRRTHQVRELHRVREIDIASMVWLARQPGRNLLEKIGRRGQALAVVRETDVNLVENRVTRRVAYELRRLLEARLATVPVERCSSAADRERRHALEELQDLVASGVRESGLDAIPLVSNETANNVLLSHPDYHRAWQTLRWSREFHSDLESAWRGLPHRLPTLMFWILAARIRAHYGAGTDDSFCTVSPGFGDEPFGLTRVDSFGTHYEPHRAELWMAIPPQPDTAGKQFLIGLTLNSGIISLTLLSSAEAPLLKLSEEVTIQLRFELPPRAQLTARRLRLMRVFVKRGILPEKPLDSYLDTTGLALLSRFLAELLHRAGVAASPLTPGSSLGRRALANFAGIDVTTRVPRIFTDGGQGVPVRHLACARKADVGELGAIWAPWSIETAFLDLSDPAGSISVAFALAAAGDPSATESDARAGALETVGANLRDAIAPAPAAQLAIATPEELGQPARRRLRSVLGAGFQKTWLVDRSLAAALGWQCSPSFAPAKIREGDALIVVDAEARSLRLTLLTARVDSQLEGHPFHGVLWERDLAARPLPGAARCTYSAFVDELTMTTLRTAASEVTLSEEKINTFARWIGLSGEAERVVECRRSSIIALPLESGPVFFSMRGTPDLSAKACAVWFEQYRDWLAHHFRSIMRSMESAGSSNPGAVHVLYIGRPFFEPSIRGRLAAAWQSASSTPRKSGNPEVTVPPLRPVFHHAPQDSHLFPARGAQSFLERYAAGLPTWQDLLPELYLVFGGAQGSDPKILERQAARPGETIQLEVRGIELPQYETEYLLPVTRGKGGERLSYAARLRPPGFPLSRPLPVRLTVSYTYASEDYRIVVRPADPLRGAFQEIEPEWVEPVNTSPELQERNFTPDPRRLLMNLRNALEALSRPESAFHEEFATLLRYIDQTRSLGVERSAEEWEALGEWLDFFIEKLPAQTDAQDARISADQRRLISMGALSLAKFVVPYAGAPSGRVRRISSLLHGAVLKGSDRQIVASCACHLLEVCVQDPSDQAHREALGALVEHLRSRSRHVFRQTGQGGAAPIWNLSPPLGALALILLADERFVRALVKQEQHVESLLSISADVLDTIAMRFGSLAEPDAAIVDRFLHTMRNVSELLIGVLRLRAAPGVASSMRKRLQVGDERLARMARDVQQIDFLFRKVGRSLDEKSRLALRKSLPRGVRMSKMAYGLYSYLAGYDPGPLMQAADS